MQVGFKAVVLEQGEGLREEGAAIGLWSNAWRALDVLGAAEQLRSQYVSPNRCAWAGVSEHGLSNRCLHRRDPGAAARHGTRSMHYVLPVHG